MAVAPNYFGETALHIAARFGNCATCSVLVEAGAPFEQYDDNGLLPLHVAALTEVVTVTFARRPLDAYKGTIAEQLLLAGADTWARTYNRDLKRPFELADGGFYTCYSTRNGVPITRCKGPGYFPGTTGTALDENPTVYTTLSDVPLTRDRLCGMRTDTHQRNDLMYNYLKDATTPGTAVFDKARAAEIEWRPGSAMFAASNAQNRNSDVIGQGNQGDTSEKYINELFQRRRGLSGVVDASRPSPMEMEAIFARGREEDNARLRFVIFDLRSKVSLLESELVTSQCELKQSQNRLKESDALFKESEEELSVACDEVDALLAENAELQISLSTANRSSASVVSPAPVVRTTDRRSTPG